MAAPLDPNLWQRISATMADALEQPPDCRDTWLDEACADDARLREEVASLLAADARAGTFLEQAAVAHTGAAEAVTDAVHRTVGLPAHAMLGPYRVLREIGHGGMGAVYLATRADAAFEKDVAIKVVRGGLRNDALMRRFRDERRILATLDHPNIARLLDAGATADGLPYLVMDYVDGVPIDAYCTNQGIGLHDRLRMFRQVCDAVQYAHQHLVIHRDIKPGNILVTGDGTPKLLDFGIAKLLDEHGDQARTHTALRAFTLENASPEQVRGEPMHVTSDVYALGVLLYRLVTGQPPYGTAALSDTALVRAVCDEAPVRPADAARTGTRIPVSAELEWVILKALRKEPNRRYPSVAQFADDVRRLLEGLPVLAGPDSRRYRARKFLTRHWLAVSAGALLVLSVAGGVTATLWQARRADEQRGLAQQRLQDTRRLANSMIFEVNDALANGRTSARALLLTRAIEQLDALAAAPADDPALAEELATAYHRLGDIFGQSGGPNVGDRGAGLASHRKGLALRSALAEAAPGDLERRAHLVQSLVNTTYAEDEIEPSFAHARRAVSLAGSLFEARPRDVAFSRLLGLAYYALGSQHRTVGETNSAFENFEKAAPLFARVYEAEPTARARRELALAHKRLGAILVDQRRFDDALVHLRAAVEFDTASLGESPGEPTRQRDLSQSNIQLGFAFQGAGDAAGALAAYRRALALREQLASDDPTSIQGKRDVASVLRYVGAAEIGMGRPDQAIGTLQRAVALNRVASFKGDDVPALILRTLAEAYERHGQPVQASEWGRRALAEYRAQLERQPGNRRLARGLAEEARTLGDVLSRLAMRDPLHADPALIGYSIGPRRTDMTGHCQTLPSESTTPGPTHARPAPARSPLVFMFPGQSSATPRLLVRARLAHAASAHVLDVAYRVLGAERASRYLSDDGAVLESNRDVQLSVFLATQMYLTALACEGVHADQSLGLSLGEYSHLVEIGALDLEDALALVDERGRCYDEAPPGVMVTVMAVDHDTVADVVAQAQAHGPVVISNYNAPTQHVLAGTREAVARAAAMLEDEHGAITKTIEERVPMHSPLMRPVAEAFAPALTRAPWRTTARSYWPNVASAPIACSGPQDFIGNLTRHVSEPVRWHTSIDAVMASHPDASFVEVGPGHVLHNMLSRARRGVRCSRVDVLDDAEPAAHFRSTIEVLRDRL